MEVVTLVLLLLGSVVLSNFVARLARNVVPLPFVEIMAGAILAYFTDKQIDIDPEVFLLLFIAPLLFLDGWRTPTEGLLRDRWTIGALALGLVLFTVAGAGYFIHWLFPAMPLALAFALAAILSPTDAVAVSAITARTPLPKRLKHIIEGEALLNDASGLVCLRFAIAAMLTGAFSFATAAGIFVWLAVGGITVGVLVTVAASSAKDWMSRRFGEETGSQILISLLIPFVAYLLAVRIGASGILAAVAAGIAMNFEEKRGVAQPITRIRRAAVWEALQFAGNGTIFVLLGFQLPSIVLGARANAPQMIQPHGWGLVASILLISAALLGLRFVWVWMSLRLVLFKHRDAEQESPIPGFRLMSVMSLAGVRGALTLAGVMTLPLSMSDGSPLPLRELAIMIAAGCIIVSLLAASVGMPFLMKGVALPPDTIRHTQEEMARTGSARAAIGAIEERLSRVSSDCVDTAIFTTAGARLIAFYRQRLEANERLTGDIRMARRAKDAERELHLVALRAERAYLYKSAREGRLGEEAARALVRELDLQESRFGSH